MNLTRAAIEKNRITFVMLAVLVVAGVKAYRGMPQSEDPGFTIRTAMVITYFPGASASLIKGFITTPILNAITSVEGVDYLTAESNESIS